MTLDLDRSQWQRVKFGDVVVRVAESGLPTGDESRTYVGLEHMPTDGSLTIRSWGSEVDIVVPKTRVKAGDVLFARRNTYLRRVAVAPHDGYYSPDGYAFRPATAAILMEFLPWVVASQGFMTFAIQHSAGTHSKRVKWSELAKYEFDLPPLDQQRRIADLLWAVEKHLGSLEHSRDSLSQLAESSTADFFVQVHDRPTQALSKICQKLTVGVVVKPTQYYAERGVPALRSMNVRPGGFNLDELVYFSKKAHEGLTKSTLALGDVVVVRTGRPGEAAVVDASVAGNNAIDLIIARPGPDLDPHFLCHYLNSAVGRRAALRGSAGTAQQHFNVGALAKVEVPTVSLSEQSELVAELNAVEDAVRSVDGEIADLRNMRASLIRGFLGGEE